MGMCTVLLLSVAAVLVIAGQAEAFAMVLGSVFCDQCRDGHHYLPISGAKVELECEGRVVTSATTNLKGDYNMELDGTPDLSACSTKATQSPPTYECNIVGSPAKSLSLAFNFLGMELYSVDPLFFYPTKTISLCGKTPLPPAITSPPPPQVFSPPPAITSPPPPPVFSPPSAITSPPPPQVFSPQPAITFPPPPHVFSPPPEIIYPPLTSPVFASPPLPSFQASACSSDYWVKREYNCHWKIVRPDSKVKDVFGEEAGKRYGHNITLWQGLVGRGDIYKALLREGTASLLNSYTTFNFQYDSVSVGMQMYWSLLSTSPHYALKQAFSFKKANMGLGGMVNAKCLLKPCK